MGCYAAAEREKCLGVAAMSGQARVGARHELGGFLFVAFSG